MAYTCVCPATKKLLSGVVDNESFTILSLSRSFYQENVILAKIWKTIFLPRKLGLHGRFSVFFDLQNWSLKWNFCWRPDLFIIRGHTPKGEEMKPWRVKNFTARIIQHEMDHLNGVLCVDRMTSTQTLQFTYWQDVNRKYGKFKLSYGGRRSLMNMWYPKSLLMLK